MGLHFFSVNGHEKLPRDGAGNVLPWNPFSSRLVVGGENGRGALRCDIIIAPFYESPKSGRGQILISTISEAGTN